METQNKDHPKSMTINMCGHQWGEINRLCNRLGLNPYDYAKTTSKKAGLLIYALNKTLICGKHMFPIPKPEDYIEVKK